MTVAGTERERVKATRRGAGGPADQKMRTCTHGNGRALCFECFRAGMERTRARRAAWTQKELPFESTEPPRKLSEHEVAHRRRMLEHLVETTRRGA